MSKRVCSECGGEMDYAVEVDHIFYGVQDEWFCTIDSWFCSCGHIIVEMREGEKV